MNVLAPVVAALMLGSPPPPPPARSLPVHRIDERHAGTTMTLEAGDRLVVRLREQAEPAWRPETAPALPLVTLGERAGTASGGRRSFGYQVRGAGEADLVFVRGPARLRYRVVSR